MTSNSPRGAALSIDPRVARDPVVARSLIGLPAFPTIVAMGPFEDRSEAEELAEAFAAVRRHCVAQLVLFGTGPKRTTVVRRAFAHGVGSDVHLLRNFPSGRWSDIVAAADVVVPSTDIGVDGPAGRAVNLPPRRRTHRPDDHAAGGTSQRGIGVPTWRRVRDGGGAPASPDHSPALARNGLSRRRSRPATSAAKEIAIARRREPQCVTSLADCWRGSPKSSTAICCWCRRSTSTTRVLPDFIYKPA